MKPLVSGNSDPLPSGGLGSPQLARIGAGRRREFFGEAGRRLVSLDRQSGKAPRTAASTASPGRFPGLPNRTGIVIQRNCPSRPSHRRLSQPRSVEPAGASLVAARGQWQREDNGSDSQVLGADAYFLATERFIVGIGACREGQNGLHLRRFPGVRQQRLLKIRPNGATFSGELCIVARVALPPTWRQ